MHTLKFLQGAPTTIFNFKAGFIRIISIFCIELYSKKIQTSLLTYQNFTTENSH